MADPVPNPAGRNRRGGRPAGLGPGEFVAAVMRGLANDTPEIGYGMSAGFTTASRPDPDQWLVPMNGDFRCAGASPRW